MISRILTILADLNQVRIGNSVKSFTIYYSETGRFMINNASIEPTLLNLKTNFKTAIRNLPVKLNLYSTP